MDFLSNHDGNCQLVSATAFMVCDDTVHSMAYIDLSLSSCGCLVDNSNAHILVFRPVDRALYGSKGGRRCDLMLMTVDKDEYCFVELKDWKVNGWFADGVEQLENTIKDFMSSHPNVLEKAKYKSAYVVNIAKRGFSRSHTEIMRNFVRRYHVILRSQQPVKIR